MSRSQRHQTFYTRGFATFVIVMNFFIIAVTGTVMFFTPRGRVAHWTNWTFLGLDKDQWSGVHITAATLFVTVAALHIFFNWKVLLGYIRLKRVRGLRLKKELAAALALCSIFVVGTLGGWPPLGTLIDMHSQIRDYWDRVSTQPPLPHAEEWTLAQLARRIDTPVEDVMAKLREKGIPVEETDVSLARLAATHHLVPSDLYALIRPEGPADRPHASSHTGGGLGRMTVSEYCKTQGVEVDAFLHALNKRGVVANRDSNLRELATSLGIRPGELIQIIGDSTPDHS